MQDSREQREKDFHKKEFQHPSRRDRVGCSWKPYEQVLSSGSPGRKVIEYGCGPGSHAHYRAQRKAGVTGIDISGVAIRRAAQRAAQSALPINFVVMDAEQLSFPERTFDMVRGRAILHHLNVEDSLCELRRVLVKNGKAIFLEQLGHNPLFEWYRRRTTELRTVDEHPLLISDLATMEKYFSRVKFRFFHLFSLGASLFYGLPGQKLLIRMLDTIDQVVFTISPPAPQICLDGIN